MQQDNRFLYKVTLKEQVTITITPSTSLGQQYIADLDAHGMGIPANGVYSFTVTRPVGKTHFFMIVFGFIAAPDGSQYRVDIDGNEAGNTGPFRIFIRKTDPNPAKTLRFEVVA